MPTSSSFRLTTRLARLGLTPSRLLATGLLAATLGFGGCAQQPQQLAAASSHGKEYFPSSKYGPASRRVVADGQPIPRGGGQYLVGKPYSVAGQTYYPSERHVVQIGNASWYGDAFHGRLTANGEIYDKDSFTAAHPTMPLPSYARVTNLRNNSSMIVRVNDRGPYASNRVMDVSRRVAEALDFQRTGTAKIKVEYVGRASLAGSDDAHLFATLRTNGPAQWRGESTMVAAAAPPARVASLAPYVPETVRMAAPREDVARADRETDETSSMPPRESPVRREQARREPVPRHASAHEAVEPRYSAHAARQDARQERQERDTVARREHQPPAPPTRLARLESAPMHSGHGARAPAAMVLPPSRPTTLKAAQGAHLGADHGSGGHKASESASRRVPLRLARSRDD